jgi:hypothetical protein
VRAPCPFCGFDPSSPSPSDAVVALRSFPRRFRALAERGTTEERGADEDDAMPGSEATDEEQNHRRAAAVDEAGQAAEIIAALGADLRRVLVQPDPSLETHEGKAEAPRHGGDPTTALTRLSEATTAVASLAGDQPGEAWVRTGSRPEGPITAIDLLREAVHAGVHHLRLAEDA